MTVTEPRAPTSLCPDPECPGWWIMAHDGDDSRDWIERCDECAMFPDDETAAEIAAAATRRQLSYATPRGCTHIQPYLAVVCRGCGAPLNRDWTPTDPTLHEYHAGCRPGAGRLPRPFAPTVRPDTGAWV